MVTKVSGKRKSSVEERPAVDVTRYFHLNDICLWETTFRREPACDGGEFDKSQCSTQTFKHVEPEAYEVERDGEDGAQIMIRALVKLGVRVVRAVGESEPEPVYTLEATFCADYFVLNEPTQDIFDNFITFNCIHNVWPFWRQHVFQTLKGASLPVPTVPLYAGQTKYRRKKVKIKRPLRDFSGDGDSESD